MRARKLAQSIFRGLGLGAQGDAARWADLAQRAWTLLFMTYREVRAAGQFIFRKDEDVDVTYPSLVAATRGPATRAKEEPATPPVSPPSPTP